MFLIFQIIIPAGIAGFIVIRDVMHYVLEVRFLMLDSVHG